MGKFRIKISESWFSKDYIVLKYSTNGIFWKTIQEYEYDVLDEWCYMVTKTASFKNAEYLLSKFKTLDDVIKYENEEKQRVDKQNKAISERNERHIKERNDIYAKFS